MLARFATLLLLFIAAGLRSIEAVQSPSKLDPKVRALREEIVSAFDDIDATLEIIIEKPELEAISESEAIFQNGLVSRFGIPLIGGPPVKNRTDCEVSQEELVNLRDQIRDILKNVSQSKGSCDFPKSSEDNCDSWLRLIQCGVQELGDGFRNATSGAASLEEIAKWKNAYDTLLDKYEKDIDNVRTSLSEEFQKKIDQLTTQLQNLSEAINRLEQELKKIQIKLCISQLSSGKTEDAATIYRKLKDDSLLEGIIRTSFNDYGKKNNINNILAFAKRLPRCELDRKAYPILFDLMKQSQCLVKPEVVTFYQQVLQCMCKSDLAKELQKYAS